MADVVLWIWVEEHEITAHAVAYHLLHWHGDHVEEEQLIACERAPLSGMMYKIIHLRAYKISLGGHWQATIESPASQRWMLLEFKCRQWEEQKTEVC